MNDQDRTRVIATTSTEAGEAVCSFTEEELWSGLDRDASDIKEHIATCPVCQARAAEFQAGISVVSSSAKPPAPPLPERIGAYRIVGRLGAGGMGIVYEGEQQTPKRRVAVKVVRGGQYVDDYRLKLFQREVDTLARLKHVGIGAIYEAGRTPDGQHFFAMELVQGQRLNDYVRTEELSRPERLELFCRICDAIHYAHLRGVIHRDLKPSNIIVGADGVPKILDFGLARITDPSGAMATIGTEIHKIMGTLPYMSPEEARGNPDEIDVRTDVYSLGVVLYELLTDRFPVPVSRSSLPESVRLICEQHPRKPGSIDRTLRGDLQTIMLKSLEKDRGRRYQSASAIAEDIQRFLANQPILARHSSAWYQIHKFVQRHLFVVVITAMLIGIVTVAAYWISIAEQNVVDTQRNKDLEARRVAILEYRLARAKHETGDLLEAENRYRSSLATFKRLHKGQKEALADFGLGTTIIERGLLTKDVLAEDDLLTEDRLAEVSFLFLDGLDIVEKNGLGMRREDHQLLVRARRAVAGLYISRLFAEPWRTDLVEREIVLRLTRVLSTAGRSGSTPSLQHEGGELF